MRATIILSAVALVQSVYGYAFPEPIAATPGIMFGSSNAGNLVKRQQICDLETGLSCRAGEYCVIIDGSVGCCPEGKVCGSIRTCVDHFTNGCENGGTVKGALCCDAAVPYCNTVDGTQFCDAVKQETVTKTMTSTTTICPHSNSTTTVSCPSAPTGNSTVTYVLPTLTPYPSDEEPVATPSNGISTTIPTTLVVAETTSNNVTTPSVTSPVSTPSGFPAEEGSAVTSSASLSVILGGIAIAFMGTLLA